jgi:hypothetical protein
LRVLRPPALSVDRVASYLLDGQQPDPVGTELVGWLSESRRFHAFVELNRDKVRKKLRTAADPQARLDVRTELRVAHLLLADRRIDLAFEAYGAGVAGPDFTVTFRSTRRFNLEVTRLRRLPSDPADASSVLSKLRQLRPSIANALLLAIPGETVDALDLASAVRAVRTEADAGDETFLARWGFETRRAFYDRFLRLGAVLVWAEGGVGAGRASTWTNESARIAVPEPAVRACLERLRA